MWFIFALIATIAWGSADLFYKKGSNPNDKYSHLKITIMVGFVMGLHAISYMIIKGIHFSPFQIIRYFPVSFFYILSMIIGYVGLRYIELSISSPIQNSSGAITAILLFVFFRENLGWLKVFSIAIITIGIIGLGVYEKKEEDANRALKGIIIDKKYQTSFLAIIFPLLYCIIDGLGTFFDALYLDKLELISEADALIAYELTFLIAAILALLYITIIKKEHFKVFKEKDKLFAALFETGGQFFYVFALAGNSIVVAPLIASYSIVSVILSRIFLKEKLSKKQYFVIGLVVLGIILLGLSDEL
ncbi:MAG TPA: EamA family transporter [Clostridiales bacterium]|nr:EamA family transporter [Clostridiales bacterium]